MYAIYFSHTKMSPELKIVLKHHVLEPRSSLYQTPFVQYIFL